MVTEEEYIKYMGVETAPTNFDRLEFLSEQTLNSIIVNKILEEQKSFYKKAIMEQINYFDINPEILIECESTGYSLGSYNEGTSQQKDKTKSINRISPVAYDILLSNGILYSGIGGI